MGQLISMFDPSDNMIGLAAIFLAMLVPIVAIMSKHQLKMTSLLREQRTDSNEQVLAELRELRNVVTQQAFAIDSLAQGQKQLSQTLSDRREIAPTVPDHVQILG